MTTALRGNLLFFFGRILPPIAVVATLVAMVAFGTGGYWRSLVTGGLVTIALALLSVILATSLGLLGAWAKIKGGLIARSIAATYTVLIRGVPDLVLILLIYFGGQRFVNLLVTSIGFEPVQISEFAAGVFAIGLIYGAYLTETFRGAWIGMPKGQIDAAKALGLPPLLSFRKVYLPQLVRAVQSSYANVWQVLLKGTAVVSVIGLQDIVNRADTIGKSLREQFFYLSIVLLFYLVLTIISENGFKWLERRTDQWAA